MFQFGDPRPNRRPSLTPLIDVVFLLLVFFMLAARFGADTGLSLGAAGSGTTWDGPPRLIDIAADTLYLNGLPIAPVDLPAALSPLLASLDDPVILRPQSGADVARLVAVLDQLRAAGLTSLVVVE